MTWNQIKLKTIEFFSHSGVVLIKALLAFIIGVILIKIVLKLTNRILAKSRIEKIARRFIYSLVKAVLYLLLLMTIAGLAGIPTAAFIALLSAAGLALSLAMQGSLSNFANGIVIIITKPFKQGDSVTVKEYSGIVKEISITHTILTSFDNKEISIPNKIIVESVVLNNSVLDQKKITYRFLVSYKSDVQKVKDIILGVFKKTDMILESPEPSVLLESLESNGIKFMATCYVDTKDYREVFYSVQEAIFNEFKREKIVLPHAVMEVKINNENNTNLPFEKKIELKQKEKQPVFEKSMHIEKDDAEKDAIELNKKANNIDEHEEEEEDKGYLDYVNEIKIIEEEVVLEEDEKGTDLPVSINTTVEEEESENNDIDTQKQVSKPKLFKKTKPNNKKQKVVIKRKN